MKMDLKNRRLRSNEVEYVKFKSLFEFLDIVNNTEELHEDLEDTGDEYDRKRVIDECLTGDDGSWRYGDDVDFETYNARLENLDPREDIVDSIKTSFKEAMNSDGLQHLFSKMISKRKRREFRDDRGRFSIPRALSGNADMYVSRKKKAANGFKIGVKLGLNANNSDQQFVKLITNLTVSVMMIEAAGIPVELHILFDGGGITPQYERQGMIMIAKASSERMNINRMALLGNVGMFRHHVFLSWCYFLSGEIDSSLGHDCNIKYEEDAEFLGLDIILGSEFKDNTPEQAFNLLTKQIFNKNDKEISQVDADV
jgi:hypothetical protein